MMRLTLRVMLAYVHGLFEPGVAEEVGRSIAASEPASQILAQLRASEAFDVAAQRPSAESGADPNDVAEYLDNSLSVEKVIEFEQRCLASPWQLAELSAAHDIVVQILARPVDCDEALRARIHGLAIPSGPSVVVEEEPAAEPAPERAVAAPIVPRPILVRDLPPDERADDQSRELAGWAVRTSEGEPIELDLSFRGLLDAVATKGNVRAWAASLVFHQVLIILLGVWMVARHQKDAAISLWATASADEVLVANELPVVRDMPPEKPNLLAMVSMPQETAAYAPALPVISRIAHSPKTSETESRSVESLAAQSASDDTPGPRRPASSNPRKLPQRERSDPATGGIVGATSVNTAVDRITGGLRTELDSGDLLIVWLFDASLSLQDDRQQVAARLEPFYQQLDGRREQSHLLMNAAVAFGNTTIELREPIRFGLKMVEAVSQVPIDNTGLENVMTAVEQCVIKYRKRWSHGMHIVVWTDESGDDTMRLEDTIALCRREGVAVSVVGPSSVFGAEQGMHSYTDPASGYRFLLPIKCGPDTCFAERLPLPYWHDSLLPAWSQNGAHIAETNQPWYGGPYREGLRSGMGPYALTRLALETGGTFTLLDHAGAGGPFTFENMQRYLPSYASAAEYLRDLKYHPLRQAVLDVVQLLSREQAKIYLPKFSFVSTRGNEYPFKTRRVYMTPAEFKTEIRDDFDGQLRRLAMTQEVLETGIARFGPMGMELEYEKETSPRWRAWYDVTRGRLLAMSLRHSEYAATCQTVLANAGMLSSDTNHIVFHPSTILRVGNSTAINRAEEAKRLLLRCIEKNPQTPWAYLAQWELDRPLGLDIEQVVIPVPLPKAAGPAAPAGGGGGMPSLPNL